MATLKLDIQHSDVFFAADAHFLHRNVLAHDQRPFADVEAMEEVIVSNWNRVVEPSDTVFYLGDFHLGNDKKAHAIAQRLHGNIHYILGNHDNLNALNRFGRFASIQDYRRIALLDPDTPTGRQDVVLSHYPMLAWDMDTHGGWMVHGHTHGSLNTRPFHQQHRIFDAALNTNAYTPVRYQQLKALMDTKVVKGHH